jgi:Spy/CpxP family protein refolding chaperone
MKKMKLLIAAAAVLVASAGLVQLAPAEEAQVKSPNRGNMAYGCAVGKPMNADSHLAKMAACLGLSEAQKAKIKPLLEENFKAKQAVRADQNLTREQRRAKMLELRGQLHDKMKPILTPEQNRQFAEMKTATGHHWKGKNGCRKHMGHGKAYRMDPDKHLARMTACMGLSADQQAKIKPILEEAIKEKQAVRADQNLTREQRRAKMQQLRGQMQEKVKPLLTAEQLKKFDTCKGPAAKQPKGGNCPLGAANK